MSAGWIEEIVHRGAGMNWIDSHRHALRPEPGDPHPGMERGPMRVDDAMRASDALAELEALKHRLNTCSAPIVQSGRPTP